MKSTNCLNITAPVAVAAFLAAFAGTWSFETRADEEIFGYVKGAEPFPKGALELVEWVTVRSDKGTGYYQAVDSKTELEYGITDKLATEIDVLAMAIDTSGILIDAYVPGDKQYGMSLAGVELALKYNFLSPAKDPIGISSYFALSYQRLDPHSGQDKDTYSAELLFMFQKYFLDDQLILVGNIGLESTVATRKPIANLPPDFEWPTWPEMEIEVLAGLGISYRFAPNWFAGLEAIYDNERETVVGVERWSVQAGPTLHYGGKQWWGTLTWLPQIVGGGATYPGQIDQNLQLIEKTKEEIRLKIGYNF